MYIADNVVTETVTLRGTDTQVHSRAGVVGRMLNKARSIGGRFISIGPTGLGDPQHSPHKTERSEKHVIAGFEMREREWVMERMQSKGGDSVNDQLYGVFLFLFN
jgi:hypothetical protein